MAYANTKSHVELSGLGAWATGLWADLKEAQRKRAVYRNTLRELSVLSTRELNDLGLNRAELRRVAYQAAYGN